MDVVFAIAHRENVSPVAVSLRKDLPSAGSPEADEIMGIKPKHNVHKDEKPKNNPQQPA